MRRRELLPLIPTLPNVARDVLLIGDAMISLATEKLLEKRDEADELCVTFSVVAAAAVDLPKSHLVLSFWFY